MAKTTLPTNYVDDVLNGAMDGKRRYREIPNADGTISLEDATTYDQIGNNFGASQVNLMNDNINQSFDANKMLKTMDEVNAVTQEGYGVDALVVKELNNSLTADNAQQFQFAYDSESGKYGYKAKVEGADTFFPFKNCELKKATVPAFTGVTKSVSTDGKAHVIMLAICSGDGNTTYNLFAIYSDGEYGDSFTINRGSEPGKTGTFIQNVTDSGFTINLGVSNIVNSAICYYIT